MGTVDYLLGKQIIVVHYVDQLLVGRGTFLKVQDRVDYELWTSCEDSNGAEFKRDFMETALKLINAADFTPKYYIYDGHALQCDGTYNCGTQCISGGLYCGPDPDNDLANGVNGTIYR